MVGAFLFDEQKMELRQRERTILAGIVLPNGRRPPPHPAQSLSFWKAPRSVSGLFSLDKKQSGNLDNRHSPFGTSDKFCLRGAPESDRSSEQRNRSKTNEFSRAERLGRGAYEPPRPRTLGPTDETVSPVSACGWPGDASLSRCVSRRHDRGLHRYKPGAGADGLDRW
jgi:hypothetical protein